jgi:lipid-A-disaccharide synthase
MSAPLRVYVVTGELSGDRLGAHLSRALRDLYPEGVIVRGVTGAAMEAEGVERLFSVTELALMGPKAVIPKIPLILRRLRDISIDIKAFKPDVLVLVDAPDFTRMVAKRVRKQLPTLPIVKYVAPQIWAWRTWRGKKMRAYLDHVLALLPFEPAFYARVGAPEATYVGHPAYETRDRLRPRLGEHRPEGAPPQILILPGSRSSEVGRLMGPFGETIAALSQRIGPLTPIIPAVPHLAANIRELAKNWPVPPLIVEGDSEKERAFRTSRVALAASGTVTLELAIAGIPSIVAYRVERWIEPILRRLIKVESIVLANLVLGEKIMPEFLQDAVIPADMADTLAALVADGPERARQSQAFAGIDALMSLGTQTPSERAARTVLDVVERFRAARATVER